MKLPRVISIALVPVAFASAAIQDEAGLEPLGPKSWMAQAPAASTSNGAVFAGSDAALVVDPGSNPVEARRTLAEAARVTGVPVRYVVLTHWHPDHAAGALCLPDGDFALVATGPTRKRLAAGPAPPGCRPRLPEVIVDDSRVVELGGHQVQLLATGHGHTAGDLVVWSAQSRTLATGDLFDNRSSPYLDEGRIDGWLAALERLRRLRPEHVVPGHFEAGTAEELSRYRDYMAALRSRAAQQLDAAVAADAVTPGDSLRAFADFRQFPEYNATFEGNLRAVAAELARRRPADGEAAGFRKVAELEVGLNPHQIAFSADGATAFVAAAGSDRIAVVATNPPGLERTIPAEGTPLGVAVRKDGRLVVTRFGSSETVVIDDRGAVVQSLQTGPATSLIVPAGGESGTVLVSSEGANRLSVVDPDELRLGASFPTGRRPFPAAATADGRLAFVPNYDDASVTVIDLWNGSVRATVPVGARPSGGAVLPSGNEYAVAVRGEDRLVFINTASFEVTGELRRGIGNEPFSVVVAPDGSRAFVNNTASHDVSVVALPGKRVIARIPTGEIPIVMAVHPDGRSLWVSSEGSHTLSVFEVPPAPATGPAAGVQTEVGVLGMIHGSHRTSGRWGLDQVRDTIRRFKPDVVCIEIPPNRWDRIWDDWGAYGKLADSRVVVFPEYTGVVLPLRAELGYEIEPCAGWTREMNDLRRSRLEQFTSDPRFAERNAEYTRLRQQARRQRVPGRGDDPAFIHSPEFDAQVKAEYEIYDRYLNEWIGPGGWSNINRAHYALVAQTVTKHRGRRVLVTFGSAHKYWLVEALAKRPDVRLLDMREFLP